MKIIALCIAILMITLLSFVQVQPAVADQSTHTWDFNSPTAYSFDSRFVDISDGTAHLKSLPLQQGWWMSGQQVPGYSDIHPQGIVCDPDGDIAVAGYTGSGVGLVWIRKLDAASGAPIWSDTVQFPNGSWGGAVACNSQGEFFVAGTTFDGSAYSVWIRKYSSNGRLIMQYVQPAGPLIFIHGMALDPAGDVLVTGSKWGGANLAIRTEKCSGVTGVLIWTRDFAPALLNASAGSISVDQSGNAFVVGSVSDPLTGYSDMLIRKLSAINGAELWTETLDFGNQDYLNGVTVDIAGNPVVAGSHLGGASMYAWLSKRNKDNGDEIWANQWPGQMSYALGIARGPGQDLTVTGLTYSFAHLNDDAWMAKFTSDGALKWSTTYDSGGNDQGGYVSIDLKGNAAVAGIIQGPYTASTWVGSYPPDRFAPYGASITTREPLDLSTVNAVGFSQVLAPGNVGTVTYQLSADGDTWYYYDDGWRSSSGNQACSNSADIVNTHIWEINGLDFARLYVRAIFISNGNQQAELDEISIKCDLKAPPTLHSTWYLADGSTAWGFDEYVAIMNPNDCFVKVNIFYMETGARDQLMEPLRIDPYSRATVHVNTKRSGTDLSLMLVAQDDGGNSKDIVVERTMFHNSRDSGSIAPGTTNTSPSWYFSEACQAYGFDTYLLLMNPNATQGKAIITLMPESDPKPIAFEFQLPPFSRQTISFGWPAEECKKRCLPDFSCLNSFSIKVDGLSLSTTGEQVQMGIICERSMKFHGPNGEAFDGKLGSTGASTTWYFAEGCTKAHGMETWILLQNPGDQPANAKLKFMSSNGPLPEAASVVAAHSRKTIEIAKCQGCGGLDDISTKVASDKPIVAERAMYWDGRKGSSISTGIAEPKKSVYLAEGSTAKMYGFEDWLCIQNPTNQEVQVKIAYLTCYGPFLFFPKNPNPYPEKPGEAATHYALVSIPANTRVTRNLYYEESMAERGLIPRTDAKGVPDKEFAMQITQVSSQGSFIAERSLYWDNWKGGSVSLGLFTDQLLGNLGQLK